MTGAIMPTPGPVYRLTVGICVTGLVVAAVAINWATNTAHAAWIDTQERIQGLSVKIADALDKLEIGIIDGEEDQ